MIDLHFLAASRGALTTMLAAQGIPVGRPGVEIAGPLTSPIVLSPEERDQNGDVTKPGVRDARDVYRVRLSGAVRADQVKDDLREGSLEEPIADRDRAKLVKSIIAVGTERVVRSADGWDCHVVEVGDVALVGAGAEDRFGGWQ